MNQARYGDAGGTGRRMKPSAEDVTKAYNAEDRRQRRMGAAEAALGIAGGTGIYFGAKGARRTTRALMHGMPKHKDFRGVAAANGKQLAQMGGGTAAVGGAGLVRQHAEGHRGRAWN